MLWTLTGTSIYFFRAASKYRLPQYSEDKLSPILFFTALGIGIISNALICGSFSSIHDRYQARVIWLIPLAATLVLARILRPKRTLLSDTNALMVSLPGIFKSIPK